MAKDGSKAVCKPQSEQGGMERSASRTSAVRTSSLAGGWAELAPRSLEATEGPALFLSLLNTQQMVGWGVNTGKTEVVIRQMQWPVSCSEQPQGMWSCYTIKDRI